MLRPPPPPCVLRPPPPPTRLSLHLHRSGSGDESHVAVVSKENDDLNKPRGVKTLLSGLPVEVSALAKVLNRRK